MKGQVLLLREKKERLAPEKARPQEVLLVDAGGDKRRGATSPMRANAVVVGAVGDDTAILKHGGP